MNQRGHRSVFLRVQGIETIACTFCKPLGEIYRQLYGFQHL